MQVGGDPEKLLQVEKLNGDKGLCGVRVRVRVWVRARVKFRFRFRVRVRGRVSDDASVVVAMTLTSA